MCWPRFVCGPDEGKLDDEELLAVLSVLHTFTEGQDCFFRFSMIPSIGTEKPILFRGLFEKLVSFLSDGKYEFTPEYWWPADHSWCLCSDYDLMFTIVAGPKTLIAELLNSPTLEVLEVNSKVRIGNYAPMPK